MSQLNDGLLQLRYRWSFKKFLAELLEKRWMDGIIPFGIMICVILVFGSQVENYFSPDVLAMTAREFAEPGFVALAMAVTLISGGIDLSVGGMFAIINFLSLMLTHIYGWPALAVVPAALAVGALMGALNGFLIGFLKTRAFLTTLVTMIAFRAIVKLLNLEFAPKIALSAKTTFYESTVWDYMGDGSFLGIPSNVVILLVVAFIGHVLLTRSRPGWRVYAVGGGRRSARHVGIKVERTIFFVYVISGILTALGAVFYAARLDSAASETGMGLEILALMAVVLGGVSILGGKGTPGRALMGIVIVMVITNALLRLGIDSALNSLIQGLILLFAIGIDVKWLKHLYASIEKIYVVPTYLSLPKALDPRPGSGTVFEFNDRLKDAETIGLDQIDGPEDVILDRQGRLYGSVRQGWIVRFSGDDFSKRDIFANIGGRPLGMAFDRDENLVVCVGGMGLYGVRPDGEVYKMTDETNRTWTRLKDDSRIRLADDCDIAPDGKVYFSEATIRYKMEEWPVDGQECRPNGRLICYDPATDRTKTIVRNLIFPNGVCLAHDGRSILIGLTWKCDVLRYWLEGPKKGRIETVISGLPIYIDNINRASDGNYWLASVGLRTPVYDLAMRMPSFRLRMVKFVPPDEWLYPNVNWGCVIKFNEQGDVLESYWDPLGNYAHVTSMREHMGYLYLGGLHNNRIGRIKIQGADPEWTGPDSYWGKK
ncbi:MAG: SMP-30/gluconolactonase/LRE family protein [Desulfatiglans sp.]|jgi:ribose transport system permease protein|nr:SMP-30/gluconolactonase/LRE family protein [Desulfatiglans sp.]